MFENRRIVVTGATGVLGQTLVARLLQEGAVITATYRKPGSSARLVEAAQALGAEQRLHLELCDVSDPQSMRDLGQRLELGGPVAGWAALAGSFAAAELEKTSDELWFSQWRDNASSCFLSLRQALRLMMPHKAGSIVTVSGRPALAAGARQGVYAATKAAVLRLTEAAAAEGKPHGVRANAVVPSIIDHPVNRAQMPAADVTRWVTPDELSEVITFLLSDASRGMTGATVPVWGRV